ncbi:MAG: bifunctional diaminohydroxyphosphoribosylaminopyrimidine deaminase/5-amino-6-(5-phosphoribosylamino)uracil reductase RibD [Alphaproteobacteria bacterium]
MTMALGLARRGLGNVWPNPAVGCVLVDGEGHVTGRGWTQPGGRPHGETEALRRAGSLAKGATAYVSLEPCSHWGETPPCAERLVEAGIKRAVIAMEDPDPRVSGKGIAALEAAGMDVVTGVGAIEAAVVNAGFVRRVTMGRPMVTLKVATTLDGRIATHDGESQWITGPTARHWVHALRASHDAVLVGVGTALADNPQLTCRIPGLEKRPLVRVVIDSRLRLPLTSELVSTAREVPTWIVTLANDGERSAAYRDCGVELIKVEADGAGNPDLGQALGALGGRGITRVLAEGGSRISAALLRDGLVDRLVWFRAASVIGGDGLAVAAPFGVDHLADMAAFERLAVAEAGDDLMETYAIRN